MNLYVYHYEDKYGDECECEIEANTREEADKLLAEVDEDAPYTLLEQPDVYEEGEE
jgi:hypothetical protein